jgi:hypothetical protein
MAEQRRRQQIAPPRIRKERIKRGGETKKKRDSAPYEIKTKKKRQREEQAR